MAFNYSELIKQYQAEPETATRNLKEAFESRQLRPNEFDLGRLFEACYGYDQFRRVRSKEILANEVFERNLTEAAGAVSTASFLNITGQIVYSAVLDKYELPEFVFTKLIPTTPTQFLDGEKIAGVTQIGDEALVRNEGDPYAIVGVGEDWIFTPPVKDRGFEVPVTWEAVFSDRTGQLLERAGDVGAWLGQNKEKRAIDCVIDENTTAHRYNWRGTVIASYGNNSGTHTWDNLSASTTLLDWTSLNTAEQLFNEMTDPYTGEPYMFDAKHLVVTKQLENTAKRIISATEIRVVTPGYATTGSPTQTLASNPYQNKLEVVSSKMIAPRLATDTSWFYGDVAKYAKYMQAEPMTVLQAPTNNEQEFTRRIVARYRANERGAYVVVQPRAMVTCTV